MKLSYLITSTLLIAFLFLSCNETKNDNQETDIDGVYQSVGYGRILKIIDGEFLLADVTSLSCMPLMDGKISDFNENISYANDTITLKDGINIYLFSRTIDAPQVCKKGTPAYIEAQNNINNPERNFEILWENFKDHYAYFELRNVNPDTMYATYRPKVTAETTDAELFFILTEMLDSFDDGHISISAPDEIEEAAEKLVELNVVDSTISKETNDTQNVEKLNNFKVAEMVANKYIPDGITKNAGILRYGTLKENIGYLQINLMMGLADYGISDTLSLRDYFDHYFEFVEESDNDTKDELIGLNKTLDAVMGSFAATEALIIDVRFNGGGKDEVGMDVLKRLNSEEKIVFTKKGKFGNGFTPINTVTQPASNNAYSKPVYLLISTESASATEIMTLSSLSMPNITRIGSTTEGVFSDVLDKELPNGWDFGLSSEVYLDMNGVNYESKGIPADIKITYSSDKQEFLKKVISDLDANKDASIETAISMVINK